MDSSLTPVPLVDFDRLDDEEEALRQVSSFEGALGRGDSDYLQMWRIFQQLARRAEAMGADPTAFVDGAGGGYNLRAIDTWKALWDTCRKTIEGLNKMRNSDRLTTYILERHTSQLVQAIAIQTGEALKDVLKTLESGDLTEGRRQVATLLNRGVAEIFGKAAIESLGESKTSFGLLQ